MSDLRADTQMAVSLLQQLMKNMQGRGDREGVSALIKRLPSLLAVLPPISATMKLGGVEYSFDAPDREQNEGIADAFASSIEWLLLAPHSLSEDDIGAALTAQICLAVKRGGDPLPHLLAVCRVLLFGIQMVPGRSANLLAASPVGELAEFTKGIQEDEDSPAQWLLLQDEFQIPSDPLMPMGHVETAVMILAYLVSCAQCQFSSLSPRRPRFNFSPAIACAGENGHSSFAKPDAHRRMLRYFPLRPLHIAFVFLPGGR
jgi:hypothetical protein